MEDDELVPIIIDNGSGVTKAGLAGQTKPQLVFPTYVTKIREVKTRRKSVEDSKDDEAATVVVDKVTYKFPIENGIVQDWDAMEKIWGHIFKELKVSPAERPILLTEPPLNPLSNREKAAEILFEKFDAPAMFMAVQAVMALYASGRTTGLVVDSGHGVTHIVPVYGGFAIERPIQRLNLAGEEVTNYMMRLVSAATGLTLTTSADKEAIRELKEKKGYISLNFDEDLAKEDEDLDTWTLPDGTEIQVGTERFAAPEILFQPNLLDMEAAGLHQMIGEAYRILEVDTRRELMESIVLSGGNTLFRNLEVRLKDELTKMMPATTKIKIYAPENRQYSVWNGASIVSELHAFQDSWILREDWDEYGRSIVHKPKAF